MKQYVDHFMEADTNFKFSKLNSFEISSKLNHLYTFHKKSTSLQLFFCSNLLIIKRLLPH